MKKIYLLDTNVISELSKPCPNMGIMKKLADNEEFCTICSTVWQEIVYGYECMPEGRKKKILEQHLIDIKQAYEILTYDSFASQICGELQAKCAKAGKSLPRYDSQIAATAIANNMILITHNTEDYEPLLESTMLKVEDWWE